MEVTENSEILSFTPYNHNDKVLGLSFSQGILFTCTEYYIYAWLDRKSKLLGMFRIPPWLSDEYTPMHPLLVEQQPEQLDLLVSLLTKEPEIVRIFTAKSYYEISQMKVRKHTQKHFIPYCHTSHGAVAAEENKTLFFYPKTKEAQQLVALPSDDTCTRVRCINKKIYLGMESGRIYEVEARNKDTLSKVPSIEDTFAEYSAEYNYAISLSLFYEKRPLPILDFHFGPTILSYFGKHLQASPLFYSEKDQVLTIHPVHSLFIVFTPSCFLLLNESLHILYKDRVQGEGIEHTDRVFISQASGILSEICIISSHIPVQTSQHY